MPLARQPRMLRDQHNHSARGEHADEPRIERRKIDAGLRPVQQHVGHDDGRQRAHRRVTQRDLDAVIEPQPLPGEQERGARHESRQRESRRSPRRARCRSTGSLMRPAASPAARGCCQPSASVAATMPAMARAEQAEPERHAVRQQRDHRRRPRRRPRAGRALSAGPTSATQRQRAGEFQAPVGGHVTRARRCR